MITPNNNTPLSPWTHAKPTASPRKTFLKEQPVKNPVPLIAPELIISTLIQSSLTLSSPTVSKSVIVLGVHRSETLKALVNQAKNLDEVRDIIDEANAGNPDSKEFEARLKKIQAIKNLETESTVDKELSLDNDFVLQNFHVALSNLKLKIAKTFNDNDHKLREELKASQKTNDEKAKVEKKFEKRESWKKEQQKERVRWDAFLINALVTLPLRPFVQSPHRIN